MISIQHLFLLNILLSIKSHGFSDFNTTSVFIKLIGAEEAVEIKIRFQYNICFY